MNRRGLLAGIIAAGIAPAAIGSGILMPGRALRPWVDPWRAYLDSLGRLADIGPPAISRVWVDAERPDCIQMTWDKPLEVLASNRFYVNGQHIPAERIQIVDNGRALALPLRSMKPRILTYRQP